MAKMYSILPLEIILFSDHISLNGPSRIRLLCICLCMLAELIRDICKIDCSLVQCEVGEIPIYSL